MGAAAATQITKRRRQDLASAAEVLAGPVGLKMGLEDAIGTLYVLYSPDVPVKISCVVS